MKKIITIILSVNFLVSPFLAAAITMPQNGNDLADMAGLSAQAYIVLDADSGEVLMSKNAQLPWAPASLTKLVTALVVLDTKPKLTKAVAMTQADQDMGACKNGGACIKAKLGVKFTIDGLFHAALLPSANNAAAALARSTGISTAEFAARMNQKVAQLGATGSNFYEPTGMDPANIITAGDYAKIVTAAFSISYLSKIAGLTKYSLRSTNNIRYNQVIKNTDKLVDAAGIKILGAKTGYLNEAKYNFAALIKDSEGKRLAIVVLGEDHLYTAFQETKLLASLAEQAKNLALINSATVLGTSTIATNLNN